jgi:guanine nucleotide-binding protein G(i) subunit alpha
MTLPCQGILLLGNVVNFKRKPAKALLADYFPDYSGGNDVNRAAKYILWRFYQVNRARLNICPHLVDLTSTSSIQLVFGVIKETIQNAMLADAGWI